MTNRINFYEKGQRAFKVLLGFGSYLAKSSIEQHLRELIHFRISQLNGCAYCLDMHSKDLRAAGETEQRLYMISAWREAPMYTDRERAALAWAEAVTQLTNQDVSDEVYQQARQQFSDEELVDLTMTTLAINCFNRINVAFHAPAGGYVVGQHAVQTT